MSENTIREAPERDYLERTIATVRNHRDAENCWPQWANIFADAIEALWAERDALVGEAADLREALRWARWAMEVRQASDAATDEPFDENIGEALLKIEALAGVSPAQPAECGTTHRVEEHPTSKRTVTCLDCGKVMGSASSGGETP